MSADIAAGWRGWLLSRAHWVRVRTPDGMHLLPTGRVCPWWHRLLRCGR